MTVETLIDDSINNYLWIVIVGGFFGFFAAMGIGANDVANAFATSVGSKALSIKHAIIIALFCETAGAILLGSHVVDTIRKGIADYQCFEDNPPVLMFGCLCALLSIGIWLFVASYFEMPVSTTHSAVGAMIGMTFIIGGADCINWYEPKDTFPYVGGVSGIVLSWVISPLFSAILAMIYFAIIRVSVLRRKNSFDKAFWSFPFFVGITITLNLFLIIYKGAKGVGLDDIELWVALVSAFGGGIVSGCIIAACLKPIKKCILARIKKQKDEEEKASIEMTENPQHIDESKESNDDVNDINDVSLQEKKICDEACNQGSRKCFKNLLKSVNYEVETDLKKDKRVREIHDKAEKFDERTEESFKFLQIITAIFDSFSHGANDVANAIGPFAAIYSIYVNQSVSEDSDLGNDGYWILALGGFGIMAGLAVYGYKIIRAIGVKLCTITPSRGVAIELASSTVIIIGSRLGIPLSTTHCQIGATMGVASLEDRALSCLPKGVEYTGDERRCGGLNCTVVWKTILGWLITLIVVGLTSAMFVSFSVYAPCLGTMYIFPNVTANLTTSGP